MTDDSVPLDAVSAAVVDSGIVAILRAPTADYFAAVAEVLADNGITAMEVTLTSRGALEALAGLRRQLPASVAIGAGTVLTADDAKASADAGAEFLVSPVLDVDLVRGAGLPVYPGTYTPTELYAAHRAGAPLVKVFPASSLGPRWLSDVRGPLPQVNVMPTGGVKIEDIADWLFAGAKAVGLGGPLVGDAVTGGSLAALANRARHAVSAVQFARS
ncbi:bifunctional 4-hydroxy-2-oxoglutarate aldolase/2-dehydro-3-deoxy-phosphogluconate aldolase [Paractinoplanes brasiliensis]|uniref:2-dehydro-3-deoxyphosphogluconate aldolase/(4S)-4-hydroxy-2-oxoglutarate aldolase n=1 Tax=Paractinoplanes brasiliensis TaxID=52695 RepID=A0A4R6JWM1_9ACTN|nr:bifunctional 4-hydroxy-2-oxoglutarate aldolase/2-dehydro-3-deoxy-phosphogluconate aldolase [Actinoplanes brasiliensis]MDY7089022.1 bifunctional 4-hydroxy-2-oxoglutarate aldolase/2-dehydro-3-deoxy-phosphogluconate aldolase [Actinomycetota bacterium]TDO41173.1 2-dehydro-3-deoxyphosphogluconate aldolase/(4S)-4-hydroxy-2-oxoglutarate aldolase [Actinoplanes brasiliensis]GID26244.1 2-keto-3-deoxy-phosphogluconate aldolase [Actinoplanes brasiliensis]